MDADIDQELEGFRDEVRSFLRSKLTPDILERSKRQAGLAADPELGVWWHRTLNEKGWAAPAWPQEYGGTGWDVTRRHVFEEECIKAGAPVIWVSGIQLVGPVVMEFGTQAQKDLFLPAILSSEHYWAQGFSEPGSGSDLASLSTRAERDGDDYVVNGSKIWTTHAHHSNWLFLLVRTSNEGKPQAGISFLLTPTDTPGITVQPILSMSGEHEVNQVFFDNVRIPVTNRVGDENQGWTIAKYLLEFERGGSYAALAQSFLDEAKENARIADPLTGQSLWDDPMFRRRVALAQIKITAQSWTEKRSVASAAAGQNIGNAMASILKLRGAQVQQEASEIAMYALGELGLADQRDALAPGSNTAPIGPACAVRATAKYLNARAASIYGGSDEVQRNILARYVLSGAVP